MPFNAATRRAGNTLIHGPPLMQRARQQHGRVDLSQPARLRRGISKRGILSGALDMAVSPGIPRPGTQIGTATCCAKNSAWMVGPQPRRLFQSPTQLAGLRRQRPRAGDTNRTGAARHGPTGTWWVSGVNPTPGGAATASIISPLPQVVADTDLLLTNARAPTHAAWRSSMAIACCRCPSLARTIRGAPVLRKITQQEPYMNLAHDRVWKPCCGNANQRPPP